MRRQLCDSVNYISGVALIIAGVCLFAFFGLSLLLTRRLPLPLAQPDRFDWLGVIAGGLLLLIGVVQAIVGDFKRRTRQRWTSPQFAERRPPQPYRNPRSTSSSTHRPTG